MHWSTQEQIALAVSEVNACDYCLSAHSALGRERLSKRRARRQPHGPLSGPEDHRRAAVRPCGPQRRGGVSDDELAGVRRAGFSDAEIVEIIAHVAVNVFTNFVNRAAETEIDFPRVTAGQLV